MKQGVFYKFMSALQASEPLSTQLIDTPGLIAWAELCQPFRLEMQATRSINNQHINH